MGFDVNGKKFSIIVWVVNIWILSTSWAEMVQMGIDVSVALQPMLPWKPSSAKLRMTGRGALNRRLFTLPNLYN